VPLPDSDLFAIGIGCDLAGAYLLARGLLLSPDQLWRRQTIGGTETRILNEAEDRVMGDVGIVALIVGFVLQAVGYAVAVGVDPGHVHYSTGRAFVALGLAAGCAVVWLLIERATRRPRLRRLLLRAAVARTAEVGTLPGVPSMVVLLPGAEALGVTRRQDESDEDYVRRAFGVDQLSYV
jgi:hypothetical protein